MEIQLTEQINDQANAALVGALTGTAPEETGVPVRVSVEQIINQIHQHWARQMAGQIQANAELAAALEVQTDRVAELESQVTALKAAYTE